MNAAITFLVLGVVGAELPVGTQLHYTGTLNKVTQSGLSEVKAFSFTIMALSNRDGNPQIVFHLEERGGGSWAWPERIGALSLDRKKDPKSLPPRVLLLHDSQQYPLTIRSPLFEFSDKLAVQAQWNEGGRDYAVTGKTKFKDHDCFQVDVASNFGRMQSLVVDSLLGMVVSAEEKKIIGRGEEFQLKWQLLNQTQLDSDEFEKSGQTFELLQDFRAGLDRTGEQKDLELSADQINRLRDLLPNLEKVADETSWSRFIAAIARDLRQQRKRLEGVDGLRQKMLGKSAPRWRLTLADGKTISAADYDNRVVVFHFWQYRGEPLNEPYGQIGYLDFLNSKRKKLGVTVIGVNVDERFGTAQSVAATRSMKNLLDFMKISYDMAVDDGSVLSEFGDPRSSGAPLPLWLVIGHDGTVTHFHSGYYSIRPDEGLKQLDEAVIEAVRRQKG